MAWELAGKHVYEVNDALAEHDASSESSLKGKPAELDDEVYLIRSMHLVPYYPPAAPASDHSTRERLNLELCDRVFRISDARDVTRSPEAADEAIAALMQRYESVPAAERRGIGRILFGRIVSRIQDLSSHYLDFRREARESHEQEKQLLQRINELYHYVMVEQQSIFECVRLYDHSIDRDGIIEEIFSEIGKTQQLPIDHIYNNRVIKIGAAMAGIDDVADTMTSVLTAVTTLPLDDMRTSLRQFSALARRLAGIPSSDHLVYDEIAAAYVNMHDQMRDAVSRLDHLNVMRGESHHLAEWLQNGVHLIHSIQNIRDGRANSIIAYNKAALRWTEPITMKHLAMV